MKRFRQLLSSASVAGLLALSVPAIAQAQLSGDFVYVANPPRVEISPDTVVPGSVPFCRSRALVTIICYSPNFVRTAYNFPTDLDGSGQTILIVDAFGSPTIRNDLAVFDRTFGIPDPPSFTILCPNGCPTFNPKNAPQDEIGWTIETTLDVEWAHATAPGASIVLVVASDPHGSSINDAESKAIAQFPGSVISQSFGVPESAVTANNAQILQAHRNYVAAQNAGITVLASAGDGGATNGGTSANALFPSSDPLVTSVGGTEGNPYLLPFQPISCEGTCTAGLVTFTGSCATGPRPGVPTACTPVGYGGEQVWNEHIDNILIAATGGSPSLLFPLPDYQSGLGLSARTTPDISYNAAVNGGVLVYYTALGFPIWFVVGGTSAGSPQWAGIVALANQASANQGRGPLGFINPTLYRIGKNPATFGGDFHDITVGNNKLFATPVGFDAKPGYDIASGWGTPNVTNLVSDLVSTATS